MAPTLSQLRQIWVEVEAFELDPGDVFRAGSVTSATQSVRAMMLTWKDGDDAAS
jgi:hypothetical protein